MAALGAMETKPNYEPNSVPLLGLAPHSAHQRSFERGLEVKTRRDCMRGSVRAVMRLFHDRPA